jgi:hypothetical protein
LRTLLISTKNRREIKWRIIAAHHPLYSVGEHGGYSEWDPEEQRVHYLNHCNPDSDAVGYFLNLADPEDLCAERYRAYQHAIKAVIRQSGVPVQIFLAGHDHSLQLLYYPDRDSLNCPKIHIVSGAGSHVSRVKSPAPQLAEYTCPDNNSKQQGKSQYGFVRFDFKEDHLYVRFFSGKTGREITMSGKTQFCIDLNGNLVEK